MAKSDQDYLEILLRSVNESVIDGVRMPDFPHDELQLYTVGSSNEKALRAGFRFYKAVKGYCKLFNRPLQPDSRILDFGCGWGRITRFFFNNVKGENVVGVDVQQDLVKFCRKRMHHGKYYVINPLPPAKLPKNSFDLIFAHSVLSHLEEGVAMEWIKEFARLLKPGGIVVITTWGKTFLDRCEALRNQAQGVTHNIWAQAFVHVEKAKEDYDQGKFLFEPGPREGGPLDKAFFGLALIPRQYVEKEYTKHLKLLDFVDEKVKDPQAMFVMQKV